MMIRKGGGRESGREQRAPGTRAAGSSANTGFKAAANPAALCPECLSHWNELPMHLGLHERIRELERSVKIWMGERNRLNNENIKLNARVKDEPCEPYHSSHPMPCLECKMRDKDKHELEARARTFEARIVELEMELNSRK